MSKNRSVVDVVLTDFGKAYLLAIPHLHDPFAWRWVVGTAIAAATLAVSLLALLTACHALNKIN